MYICVCVCMYVRMYVCMYVCLCYPQRKVIDSVQRLMSTSAAGGLASIQCRQLKGQRVFWYASRK